MGKKNYYEVLGVSRMATQEQIKKRYRQLVRTCHPDVSGDKSAAKAAFLEISEAYQTLINPDRRLIYDTSIDREFLKTERPAAGPGVRRARAKPTTHEAPRTRAANVQKLIRDAQAAFIRRDFGAATWACKAAQKLDPQNVRAHVILGDIYKSQGKIDSAIAMYTVAVQLDPRNPEIQAKLDRLLKRGARTETVPTSEQRASLRMGLNLVCWPVAGLMLIVLSISPGQPIGWLERNMAFIGSWSGMLVATLLIDGVLIGFLLSVNEAVQSLDDELVFQGMRTPGARTYPLGLILLAFNILSFYVAAAVYVLIGVVQETLSRSVLTGLIATFGLVALVSVIYEPGHMQVFLFGGTLTLPAVLIGWAMGDMLRPAW
jgi:tetratricopeptide (TPR) repeat protein